MPMGEPGTSWAYGDLDAGFKQADLVLDETFHTQATSHQPLETRTAMAHWENGKLYLRCSTQSVVQTVASVAKWVGIDAQQVVVISEYTGGGFGSKIPGTHTLAVPALLAKKTGTPVMMRISREEEHFVGRCRPSLLARVKAGFRKDGRLTAVDMFVLQDAGPYEDQFDLEAAPAMCSLAYQPIAMRFRGLSVLTNTPPPTSQRAPGGMQQNAIMEPLLAKAARQLGIDAVALHRINAPAGKALFGPPGKEGKRSYVTSAFVREAIDRGVELFDWNGRKARSGKRSGAKARGIGISVSPFIGGYSIGYDGLMIIRPDGKLYVQSGIGNLGTHSVIDTARVAAEVLDMPWDRVEVVWGDTSRNLPWTCTSDGSQTVHAMSRSNHAGAMDAKRKLQEIAAKELGGRPEDYGVGGARVYHNGDRSRHLTFEQAAQRAIKLGGKFDGHELPSDIHAVDACLGGGARRPGRDGCREGQLSARRRDALLRHRVCRSRSRRRDRDGKAPRLRGGRGRRHRRESSRPRRASARRQLPRDRPRADAEDGLRPAVRRAARGALPLQQAADHPRRAAGRHASRRASTFPIRKRRSARAASASRRSAPASVRSSPRSSTRLATTCSGGFR